MKEISILPWVAIRQALADLKKCEAASETYSIDMAVWHTGGDSRCSVCLAGAVMAQSLGASPKGPCHPGKFKGQTALRLCALDRFRCGQFLLGLELFKESGFHNSRGTLEEASDAAQDVVYDLLRPRSYDGCRDGFFEDMEAVASAFEGVLA